MTLSLSGAVAFASALVSLIWIGSAVRSYPHRRRTLFLADLPIREPGAGWPRLAVVVAARDEAAEVEAAIRSLLEQDYPNLAVVAVDDRSADGTGGILDRVAATEPGLRVIHLERVKEHKQKILGKNRLAGSDGNLNSPRDRELLVN